LSILSEKNEVRLVAMTDSGFQPKYQLVLASLTKATTGLAMLLAFGVVIPLTLWSAWTYGETLANQLLMALFCVAFAWVFISMILCYRRLRELGLDGKGRLRLFSGPRPNDQSELRAWILGWHFIYAVIAVLLCMAAMPISWWLGRR
jgi:hypothetical protein